MAPGGRDCVGAPGGEEGEEKGLPLAEARRPEILAVYLGNAA